MAVYGVFQTGRDGEQLAKRRGRAAV